MINISLSDIIKVGALVLAASIWYDLSEILKQRIRIRSYEKIFANALEIAKILHKDYKKNIPLE